MISYDFFKTKLKDIAPSGYWNYSPPNFLLTQEHYQLLKNLSDDLIMKSDKGNRIVLVNKDDFLSKMHEILTDTTKFKLLSSNLFKHTINQENQLWSLLHNLKKDVISKETYEHLASSGSQPGIMYSLPKIHKD